MSNEIELKRNKYDMLKCIWMNSGVIDYKLCDHNFDCENCPFDKVIRNLCNKKETDFYETVNDANTIFNKLQSVKYDNNIIYLKNQEKQFPQQLKQKILHLMDLKNFPQ